jgi:peroxiredoxin
MAQTPSTMLELGTVAPAFALPDSTGKIVRSSDLKQHALLVVFMCNHCPFVKHIAAGLAQLGRDLSAKNVAMIAINSNDAVKYPDDGPDKMAITAKENNYTFPYLVDADQSVAKAYRAACTPDFFLFDRDRKLVYRGQFDDSRPSNSIPVSGSDVRRAIDAALAGNIVEDQKPSVGCNIKWKSGNEPAWFARR